MEKCDRNNGKSRWEICDKVRRKLPCKGLRAMMKMYPIKTKSMTILTLNVLIEILYKQLAFVGI
jgi:hypothetical protein